MSALDWVVVAGYLGGTLWLGVWMARRGSKSLAEYFVGGRAIPWWLAGASMAATTFNVDTPLYVTGLVARRGVAGNWEWWSFAFAHVLMAVVLARLWRRAEVMTDAELIELRYRGGAAALLRGTRAFFFGIPLNCIAIGYGMLAMRKVLVALDVVSVLNLPGDPQLWAVIIIVVLTLVYAAASGLWGVVTTDFLQLVLALVGAVLVAGYALAEVGGLGALRTQLEAAGRGDALRMVPRPGDLALPFGTFLAYLTLQWWTFRGADGGGMFVQRLSSVRDEREAERAAGLFNILNYVVRTWPWVIVALAALVVLPQLDDPELAYPLMMKKYLPAGVLGLVFASLLAAFMSTVSTQVNWGASYAVRDLYQRFVAPEAGQERLVAVGRAATVVITMLAALASFFMDDVGKVFRFMILFGNGTGAVLLLRWFWWRVNAWTEWSALLAGTTIAVLLTAVPTLAALSFGAKLAITAFGAMAVWVPVMLLTPPERAETLDAFFILARPGGPGWGPVRERTGVAPAAPLGRDLAEAGATLLAVVGLMLALGGVVVGSTAWVAGSGATALVGWWGRRHLRRER
ncbi:MAG: sodium:solute symporter family protein [Gemmatimonadales bacterium]|nr:sodium:solute symporter family protein [Gemmatimonadales bacterium]